MPLTRLRVSALFKLTRFAGQASPNVLPMARRIQFKRIVPRPVRAFSGGATPTDVAMMREALVLAERGGEAGEVPVGAIVYETATGKVLGRGANRRETDADPIAHAEAVAIREAAATLGDWRLNACTLVVTLEPCPMCAGACVNARVGRVVYGAGDPKAGASRTLYAITEDARLNHRCVVVAGVLAAESAALLRGFFRARRRR